MTTLHSCLVLVLSHRVLRHTAVICASRSLSARVTACRSNTLPGKVRREEREEECYGSMLVFVDVENINTVCLFLQTLLIFPCTNSLCTV